MERMYTKRSFQNTNDSHFSLSFSMAVVALHDDHITSPVVFGNTCLLQSAISENNGNYMMIVSINNSVRLYALFLPTAVVEDVVVL